MTCDMTEMLQAALRRDQRARAAAARAHQAAGSPNKAMLVWSEGWVKHPGEEGKGLAGVREAIMVEVAFAPEACRTRRMNGYVVLSLDDSPGGARLALGSGDWRWSDLLGLRR